MAPFWLVFWAGVLGVFVLSLPVLTMLGAHRRGYPWPLAFLAGLSFPVMWAAWYVRDEHPHARAD